MISVVSGHLGQYIISFSSFREGDVDVKLLMKHILWRTVHFKTLCNISYFFQWYGNIA